VMEKHSQGWLLLLLMAVAHVSDAKVTIEEETRRHKYLESIVTTISMMRHIVENVSSPINQQHMPEAIDRHHDLDGNLLETSATSGVSVGDSGNGDSSGVISYSVGMVFVLTFAAFFNYHVFTTLKAEPPKLEISHEQLPKEVKEPAPPPAPALPKPEEKQIVVAEVKEPDIPEKPSCGSKDPRDHIPPTAVTLIPTEVQPSPKRPNKLNPMAMITGFRKNDVRKIWNGPIGKGSMEPRHLEYSDYSLASKHIGLIPLNHEEPVMSQIKHDEDLNNDYLKPKPRLPIPNELCDDHKNNRPPQEDHAFNVIAAESTIPTESAWVDGAEDVDGRPSE